MYMSEDVILWPHPLLDGVQQLFAARPVAAKAQVPVPQRGAVGHQNVYPRRRNQVPLVLTLLPPFQVERPPTKLGLPTQTQI